MTRFILTNIINFNKLFNEYPKVSYELIGLGLSLQSNLIDSVFDITLQSLVHRLSNLFAQRAATSC